jgi:hypothetical protein
LKIAYHEFSSLSIFLGLFFRYVLNLQMKLDVHSMFVLLLNVRYVP